MVVDPWLQMLSPVDQSKPKEAIERLTKQNELILEELSLLRELQQEVYDAKRQSADRAKNSLQKLYNKARKQVPDVD
jgi:hypothetical protein